MRFVKPILILLLIIFIFYLIGKGQTFWGIFLLFVLITYIYNTELRKIGQEFNWIASGLMDDNTLKDYKEQKALHYLALGCLYDGKIKKGANIEEFAKVLLAKARETGVKLDGTKSSFLRDRAAGVVKYDKEKENYTLIYSDYGAQMPTPALRLKFKKGALVGIEQINHGYEISKKK